MKGYALVKTSTIPKGRTNTCTECGKKPNYILSVGRQKVCRECYDTMYINKVGFPISQYTMEELLNFMVLGYDFARIAPRQATTIEEFVHLLFEMGKRNLATRNVSYAVTRDGIIHLKLQIGEGKVYKMDTEKPIIMMYLNYLGQKAS